MDPKMKARQAAEDILLAWLTSNPDDGRDWRAVTLANPDLPDQNDIDWAEEQGVCRSDLLRAWRDLGDD